MEKHCESNVQNYIDTLEIDRTISLDHCIAWWRHLAKIFLFHMNTWLDPQLENLCSPRWHWYFPQLHT